MALKLSTSSLAVAEHAQGLEADRQVVGTSDVDTADAADIQRYRTARYGDQARYENPDRYRDQGVGHAAGWCPRQQGAAEKLEGHWRAALPLRGLPRSYGDWGSSGGSSLTDEQAAECQAAWTAYDTAMGYIERECSPQHASALRMVVVYKEPTRLDAAWRVREALTYLADHWGLDAWGICKR